MATNEPDRWVDTTDLLEVVDELGALGLQAHRLPTHTLRRFNELTTQQQPLFHVEERDGQLIAVPSKELLALLATVRAQLVG